MAASEADSALVRSMADAPEKRLVQQAFRFELDPNKAQRVLLAKSVGCSRFVYNWGLAESQRTYEVTGKRPRLGELKTRLVELKRGRSQASRVSSARESGTR